MKEIIAKIAIIKKCPFCGSPAEFTSESKEFVRCSKGLQCPTENASFSVEDWNSRPPEVKLWEIQKALFDIRAVCKQSGFISTDAKFKQIEDITEKALIEISNILID